MTPLSPRRSLFRDKADLSPPLDGLVPLCCFQKLSVTRYRNHTCPRPTVIPYVTMTPSIQIHTSLACCAKSSFCSCFSYVRLLSCLQSEETHVSEALLLSLSTKMFPKSHRAQSLCCDLEQSDQLCKLIRDCTSCSRNSRSSPS